MRDALGDDFEALDDLAGALRVRATPKALDVNCASGEMISPSGRFNDVGSFERLRREALGE